MGSSHRPSRRLVTLVAFLASLLALALPGTHVAAQQDTSSSGEHLGYGGDDVRAIADKLQCPVCEGTSVADSPSPVAQGMRASIRRQLDEGSSESEIFDFFVDRYGLGVLREPPKTGFYSAVWWVPGVGIVFGLAAVYGVLRKRRTDRGGLAIDGLEDRAIGTELPEELPDEEMEQYRQRVRELEQGGS